MNKFHRQKTVNKFHRQKTVHKFRRHKTVNKFHRQMRRGHFIIVARIAYRDTMYRIVAICCERDASQADAARPLIIVARIAYRDTVHRIVSICCERNASQADAAGPLYNRGAYRVSRYHVSNCIHML